MSKIIKASQITGEYKLQDIDISQIGKKVDNTRKNSSNKQNGNNSSEISGQMVNQEISQKEYNNILTDAEKEAETIIKKAEKKAEKIVYSAEKKAENIKNDAYNKGYEKGLSEGKETGHKEGLSKLNKSVKTVQNIGDQLKTDMAVEKEQLLPKVIDLSIQIASKIINTKIKMKPEIINNIVSEMLAEMINGFEEIVVKVTPKLVKYIDQNKIEKIKLDTNIEFRADNSLMTGDCVIETNCGGKDGTMQNKLNLIEKELLKE